MKSKELVLLFLILASAIFLYWPAQKGFFLYDDVTHIAKNPKIYAPQSLTDPIFNGLRHRRVVMNLTYGLNGYMSGLDIFSYKIFNLALHLLTVTFLFLWLKNVIPHTPLNLAITGLFALHPLQVQSVAYVFGRVSLLSGLVTFFSLFILSRKKEYPLKFLIPIFILGLLTKESLITFAVMWPLYQALIKEKNLKFLFSKPAFITYSLTLFYAPIHLYLVDPTNSIDRASGFHLYPIFDYTVNQLFYYFHYFYIFFNPVVQSIFHPLRDLSPGLYIGAVMGTLIILLTFYLFFKWIKEKPLFSFMIAFFYLNIFITNGPIQMINPFNEYRLYLSNLTIMFFVVIGVHFVYTKVSSKFIKIPIIGIAMSASLFFCYVTHGWAGIYGSRYDTYRFANRLYPDYEITNRFLAYGCGIEQNYRCAIKYLNKSFEYKPRLVKPKLSHNYHLITLAKYHHKLGEYDKAKEVLEQIPKEIRSSRETGRHRFFTTLLMIYRDSGETEAFNKLYPLVQKRWPKLDLNQLKKNQPLEGADSEKTKQSITN